MILVVLNRNSRNLKEGEVDVNYADLYLKKHFLQQEIDNYDVYFTENTDKKNSLMKDMLDDFKITIQNDTKMSEEQINTIFKSYYEKVKENTTYKISKYQKNNNILEYTIEIMGNDIQGFIQTFKTNISTLNSLNSNEELFNVFINSVNGMNPSTEKAVIILKFKKDDNNKVTLSSNKLIIVQLYLSFYTGTKKITDIKRYFEAFKDIEKNSN